MLIDLTELDRVGRENERAGRVITWFVIFFFSLSRVCFVRFIRMRQTGSELTHLSVKKWTMKRTFLCFRPGQGLVN